VVVVNTVTGIGIETVIVRRAAATKAVIKRVNLEAKKGAAVERAKDQKTGIAVVNTGTRAAKIRIVIDIETSLIGAVPAKNLLPGNLLRVNKNLWKMRNRSQLSHRKSNPSLTVKTRLPTTLNQDWMRHSKGRGQKMKQAKISGLER